MPTAYLKLGMREYCARASDESRSGTMNTVLLPGKSFRDLDVYRIAFELQQNVFQSSRHWSRHEAGSLTDSLLRSSRSIGANIADAWARRRHPVHCVSQLTDADAELQQTLHWLSTARECDYLDLHECARIEAGFNEVGRRLGTLMAKYRSKG